MAGPRNRHGVNDQADCYRTINGLHYIAWVSFPSAERVKQYRAAGIKCRRFGDELYIYYLDERAAREIDAAAEKP